MDENQLHLMIEYLIVKRAYDTNVPDKVSKQANMICIPMLIDVYVTRSLKRTFGNVSWLLNSFIDPGQGHDHKWQPMMIYSIDVYKRKMMVMK